MMALALLVLQVREAIDPVGLIVAAIIIFNLIAPLFGIGRRRRRMRQLAEETDVSAQSPAQRPAAMPSSSTLSSRSSPALSGQSSPALSTQSSTQQARPDLRLPPYVQSRPLTTVPPITAGGATIGSLSAEDLARLQQALTAASAQRYQQAGPSRAPVQVTQAPRTPVRPSAASKPAPMADALAAPNDLMAVFSESQVPGLTLMTLESGTTAFDQLPGAGSISATPASAGAPGAAIGRFDLPMNPRAAANAFVESAIVGPCAALRTAGHTPAGW